jgi:hypothetical protein
MVRVFLDRIYLFSGYLAGLFLFAIFVLMLLLSAAGRSASIFRRAMISSLGAWRRRPSLGSRIRSNTAR